jgi:predicted metal-dependent hydrolase
MTLKNPDFARGVELFNHAHFFDAHEVLEDLWRPLPRDAPLRRHLQGMVQLAVAFHHESTGNYVGARSVLARALRNLDGAENSFPHVDLDRLRAELELWLRYLIRPPDTDKKHSRSGLDVRREAVPPMPRILARS